MVKNEQLRGRIRKYITEKTRQLVSIVPEVERGETFVQKRCQNAVTADCAVQAGEEVDLPH